MFTVGLRSGAFDAKTLQSLAAQTGGSFAEASSPKELAGIYAALGDSTRALGLLEKAAEERAFTLVFLANYPMFRSLHHSVRFRRLVDRIGVVPPA